MKSNSRFLREVRNFRFLPNWIAPLSIMGQLDELKEKGIFEVNILTKVQIKMRKRC